MFFAALTAPSRGVCHLLSRWKQVRFPLLEPARLARSPTMNRKIIDVLDAIALAFITALALFPVVLIAAGGMIH